MCGRFSITLEAGEVQLQLALGAMPKDWRPRFNVAPSQRVPVVIDADRRDVLWMKWGLVPFWAKSAEIRNRLINARAETVSEKPAFRTSFKQRRCLIPADGFYEWLKPGGRNIPSIPYYFHEKEHAAFTFAGIWDEWKDDTGSVLQSCSIITCAANEIVFPIHNRMPVILNEETRWDWLQKTDKIELESLLLPAKKDFLSSYAVSRTVNNPAVDSEVCLLPEHQQDRLF